jgi:hypothetical protein
MPPALLTLACLLGIAAAVLAIREGRRAANAEQLLARANLREAEANARLHVRHVEFTAPHHWTDAVKEYHEVIDRHGNLVPLSYTDASWAQARLHGNLVPLSYTDASWAQARLHGNRTKADLAAGLARFVR